jgi:hypothetical protein
MSFPVPVNEPQRLVALCQRAMGDTASRITTCAPWCAGTPVKDESNLEWIIL